MATQTKKTVSLDKLVTAPYGNAWVGEYNLTTNASGVVTDGSQTTAFVQSDVCRIGILPAGLRLQDALAIVSDAFSTSITHKVGFAYVDGVDSTAVPQDDDYFFAALAVTVGRTRAANTAVRPVTLPKDAYLTVTVNAATADHASAGIMDIVVYGAQVGVS